MFLHSGNVQFGSMYFVVPMCKVTPLSSKNMFRCLLRRMLLPLLLFLLAQRFPSGTFRQFEVENGRRV